MHPHLFPPHWGTGICREFREETIYPTRSPAANPLRLRPRGYERARLLYEEIDTRSAAATNRSLRTLTIFSTLLLPPTFVVGAFGMNLPRISWANSFGGFWWAIGLCTVVVGGCWIALKRYDIL